MQLRYGIYCLFLVQMPFLWAMDSEFGSKLQSIVYWKKNYTHNMQQVPQLMDLSCRAFLTLEKQIIAEQLHNWIRKRGFPGELGLRIFQHALNYQLAEIGIELVGVLPFSESMALMAACNNETLSRYEKIEIVKNLQKKYKSLSSDKKNELLEFLLYFLPASSNVDQYITIHGIEKRSYKIIRAVTINELFVSALDTNRCNDFLEYFLKGGIDIGQIGINYCLKQKYQASVLGYSHKQFSSQFLLERLRKLLELTPLRLRDEVQAQLLLYAQKMLLGWENFAFDSKITFGKIWMVDCDEYRLANSFARDKIVKNKKFYKKAIELIKNMA